MKSFFICMGLLLIGSLFVSEVFAHEGSEHIELVGIRRYIFYAVVLIFAGTLLHWAITFLPISKSIKETLKWIIGGIIVGIIAYYVYFYFPH